MKLKTLVGSMALLSLVSTGAMAATHVASHAVANSGSNFWQGIVYRNQDNNGTMPTLAAGQNAVSGLVEMDAYHADKRAGFTDSSANNKSKYSFNLNSAEIYFDWRANATTSAHFAIDYDNRTSAASTSEANAANNVSLSEGYVTLAQGNMFLNAGLQYLHFGSAAHRSILAPLTEDLSLTRTTAVTGGVFGLNGFYADAAVFNGVPYGTGTSLTDSQNRINGFTAEVGYAQNQGVNPFYGYNGLNTYLDFINDIAGTNAGQAIVGTTALADQHPAVAFHAGYVSGPFQVLGNYVAVTKDFDAGKVAISAAKPATYGVEADYSWNPLHIQTIALGYDGSDNLVGITDSASYGPSASPQTRIALTYGYHVNQNVSLQGEYANEKDYSTADGASGESANVFVGRLKVAF